MTKSLSIFLTVLLISNITRSQYSLEIEIANLRSDKGCIMLQLYNDKEVVVRREKGSIKDNKCTIIIRELNTGRYAIRYFHDENMNGTLETNKMGIPTEGYGFSNNAHGMFGPKPFTDWLFEIKEDKKIILKTKN